MGRMHAQAKSSDVKLLKIEVCLCVCVRLETSLQIEREH